MMDSHRFNHVSGMGTFVLQRWGGNRDQVAIKIPGLPTGFATISPERGERLFRKMTEDGSDWILEDDEDHVP